MNKAYYWYRPHPYFDHFYPGKVLNLIQSNDMFSNYIKNQSQLKFLKKYFPHGLSPHGLSKLLLHHKDDDSFVEPITEIVFELVRQLYYPNAPSRMTSLYASKSIEQAEKWKALWDNNFGSHSKLTGHSLWEISYETTSLLCDANFLNIMPNDEFSYISALNLAHMYWKCDMSVNPLPELLIPYPVTVLRIIRSR